VASIAGSINNGVSSEIKMAAYAKRKRNERQSENGGEMASNNGAENGGVMAAMAAAKA
jgi:hypothetical protein